jgi:hypothetical protein
MNRAILLVERVLRPSRPTGAHRMLLKWRAGQAGRFGEPGDAERGGSLAQVRRNLLEQLQPFAGHRRLHSDETGDVAARLRKARDETAADRIGNVHKHNGDGTRLLQQAAVLGVPCERIRSG